MAIAVGSTSTAGNASGTNLTVTAPASIADNDILVACCYRELGTWTPPAGWTQWGSDQTNFDYPTHDMILSVYWKRASSESGNYTFNLSTTTWRTIVMVRITGCLVSGDPADVTIVPNADNSTSVATALSITTITANTLALAFHGNYNGSAVTASTSGYTKADGLGGCEIWYKDTAATGATGNKTFGFSPVLAGGDSATFHIALKPAVSVTIEQEGFRFGVDDGSESAHTWEANQDTNITTADAVTKLLRLLANATGDPAAIAYKLKYAKNGGAYGTVPLVASTKTKPVIEAADCTVSGSNTAAASWAVSHPAASTGDLLIFYIAWDDSTTTTDVAEPTGANSETLTEINATPITDASTETRAKAWYCVCTGSWTATTKTFTPTATESWSATVVRVPAGEFDAATPIGTTATRAATGVADTSVLSAAMTAGASDGGGALLWFAGVDTDPLGGTNPTGWTILQSQDLGAVAHGVAVRNTEVTDSESIAGGDTWAIAGDSWTSIGVIVRAPTVTNDLYISASANITAGGEATTARLTAPSGKTTSDFVTGRRWDNENGTDTIDITTDDYTEVEWCLTLKSGLSGGDYFDFRVYNGDVALDTYTVTPRWTIASAAGQPAMKRWQGIPGMKNTGRVSGW